MSQNYINLELRGFITTVEPFANSPIDCKVEVGPDKGMQKLPRIGGKPFIAASAIRGMLRRAAALEAVERFPKGKVEYVDWLLFAVGGVKGSKKGKGCDPEIRHNYIENNPLVALFGAGEAAGLSGNIGGMIGSKLHIAHAITLDGDIIPKKGNGVVGGARFHENTSPILREVVEDIDSIREFNRVNHERATLENEIERLQRELRSAKRDGAGEKIPANEQRKREQELKDKKDALTGKKEEMKTQFGTDNSIGMPLTGYEVIPAGKEIRHRMTLAAVSPAQLGLFFAALERFALNPVIGAHRGHGCGRIRCEYDAYQHQRDNGGAKFQGVGRITIGEPRELELSKKSKNAPSDISVFGVEGDELKKLRDKALAAWHKEVDPENLRSFSRDGTKAQKSEAKK